MNVAQTEVAGVLISGALIMGYATAAAFFFTFWRRTADRLFALFSTAFVILAVQRLFLAVTADLSENAPWLYGLRLLAFIVILAAILDKNRVRAP